MKCPGSYYMCFLPGTPPGLKKLVLGFLRWRETAKHLKLASATRRRKVVMMFSTATSRRFDKSRSDFNKS
jgi:hypothetical protein